MLVAEGGKKLYCCDECGKSFTRSDHLTRHKITHSGQRLLKCAYCDKAFADSYKLKRHVMIHTGLKPFNCEVCERTFTEKSSLGQHMRVHTGVRSYQCDVCDKNFSQSSHLKVHMLSHRGERPFKCERCGASYSKRDALNRHTGEIPYECPLCGTFVCKRNMNIHLKQHYDDGQHKCCKCNLSFNDINQLAIHFKQYPNCNLGKGDEQEQTKDESMQDRPIVNCVETVFEEQPQKMEEVDALKDIPFLPLTIKEEFKEEEDERLSSEYGLGSEMPSEKTDKAAYTNIDKEGFPQSQQTHVPLPFRCGRCEKRYESMSQLNKCLKSHKYEEVLQVPEFHEGKGYKCDVCGLYFAKTQYLRLHRKRHKGIEGEKLQESLFVNCKEEPEEEIEGEKLQESLFVNCKEEPEEEMEEFDSLEYSVDIVKHEINEEAKSQEISGAGCSVADFLECELDAENATSDAIPEADCAETIGDRLQEEECDDSTVVVSGKLSGIHIPGFPLLPFKCGLCDKRYQSVSELFACLKLHKAGESQGRKSQGMVKDGGAGGGNPVKCEECDQSFTHTQSLKRHIMRSHTGEKPFKCTECDKSFTDTYHLTRHMRSHTGEKPFKCDQCEKSYARKDKLNKHKKTHHSSDQKDSYNSIGDAYSWPVSVNFGNEYSLGHFVDCNADREAVVKEEAFSDDDNW